MAAPAPAPPPMLLHCNEFIKTYTAVLQIKETEVSMFDIMRRVYEENPVNRFKSIIDNLVDVYGEQHLGPDVISNQEHIRDALNSLVTNLTNNPSSIWNAFAKSVGTEIATLFNVDMTGYRRIVESAKMGSCNPTSQCKKTIRLWNTSTFCAYCGIKPITVNFECEHLLECNLLSMLIGLSPGRVSSSATDPRNKAVEYLIDANAYQWSCRRCNQIKALIQGDTESIVSGTHSSNTCTIFIK